MHPTDTQVEVITHNLVALGITAGGGVSGDLLSVDGYLYRVSGNILIPYERTK